MALGDAGREVVARLVEAAALLLVLGVVVAEADVLDAELVELVVEEADVDDVGADEVDEAWEAVDADTEPVPPPEPDEQPVRAKRPRLATAPKRVEVCRGERSVRQVFMASP